MQQQNHKNIETESLSLTLSSLNLISNDQLAIAQKEQKKTSKSFQDTLVTLGFISEQTLNEVISEHAGFASVDLEKITLDHDLLKKLPRSIAEQRIMLPLIIEEGTLYLALSNFYDIRALDQARKYYPEVQLVQPVLASVSSIYSAIDRYYGYELRIDKLLHEIENAGPTDDMSWVSPVVRLVESLLLHGIKIKASDIHFQPEETYVRLRYRVDGKLQQHCAFHKSYWSAVCVRLKVLANINLAESRKPQNGRFTITQGLRNIDFRVSSHPTVYGESMVLRILDQQSSLKNLEDLGFSFQQVSQLKKLARQPQGLFIITGPTGSGKTTTMYSLLRYLNSAQLNIMTLEQPVEYKLPLIRQSEISESGATSFASGIRSILRQDPDIIFIGEIRDEETAKMALRAAMTGHLVFTTLHTNDSFSALSRLTDLGLKPGMVAPYLVCVASQRLIRLLCPSCKKTSGVGQGCEECHHTGYLGRTAVVETLEFTDTLQQCIAGNRSLLELKELATKQGFASMKERARELVKNNYTSEEEVQLHLGS